MTRPATLAQDPRPRRRGPGPTAAGALVVTAALLSATGCGTDDAPSAPEAGTREQTRTLDLGSPPAVAVVDPGAEPRSVLAYSAPASPPADATVLLTRDLRSGPNRDPSPQSMPEQRTTVSQQVAPDVDGAQKLTLTVREASSVDPGRSAQLATATGFETALVRGGDGVVRSLTFTPPAGATDAARAGVEVLARRLADTEVALPTAALGVGARWTVTRAVDDAVAPTRVQTYRLEARDGDRVTVSLTTDAPNPSRTLTGPDAAGTGQVRLDVRSYAATGTGRVVFDLRGGLPASGRLDETTKAVYADPARATETASESSSRVEFLPAR